MAQDKTLKESPDLKFFSRDFIRLLRKKSSSANFCAKLGTMDNQTYFKKIGMQGEAIAAKFLMMNKKYKMVEHNIHAQGGEIDLLMMNPEKEWVAVEVKTRTSNSFGSGKDAITKNKFQKIQLAVRDFFLKQKKFSEVPFFRIEAVILRIDDGKIFCEHIENIGYDSF